MTKAAQLVRSLPPDRELQFSTKAMIQLIWPLLIEQGLNTIIGVVNSMMVSQVGMHAISAVSLVDQLNQLFLNVFNAFAAGVTVVVSHRMGRKDMGGADDSLTQALSMATAIAVALAAVLLLFSRPILSLVFGAVDENVMDGCKVYLIGSALSYPLMAISSVSSGALRAIGDSRTPMYGAVLSNIMNVLVGALTIFVFGWGVSGASCAVFIARLTMAALVFGRVLTGRCGIRMRRFTLRVKKEIIMPVFDVGIPAGIDSLIFNGGKVLVASMVSSMGTAMIAANSIMNNLLSFASIPGNAFSNGGVTITGRCYGAKSYREARRHLRVIPTISTVVYLIVCTLLYTFLTPILGIYGADAETAGYVRDIMRMMAVMGSLTWSFSFVLPNCLRGVGDIKFNTVISVTSMWMFRVAFSYLLGVVLHFGIKGVWIGMVCDWGFREICYTARMLSEKWLFKAVARDNAENLAQAAAAEKA